jgi:hypothetical protein
MGRALGPVVARVAVVLLAAAVAAWLLGASFLSPAAVEANTAPVTARERATLHVFLRDSIQDTAMELQWWLRLLQLLERPVVVHPPTDQLFVSNAVIVCFDASSFADGVAEGLKSGRLTNVGLWHAGDERGFSTTPQQHYAKFSFVFRTYWLEKLFRPPLHPRLVWVPNGPRANSGVAFVPSALPPPRRRKHLCSCKQTRFFLSFLNVWQVMGGKSENPVARTLVREEMRKSLERQGSPCLFELTTSFGGVRSHLDYVGVMRDSVFSLCPRGHSEEASKTGFLFVSFFNPLAYSRRCVCMTRFRRGRFR